MVIVPRKIPWLIKTTSVRRRGSTSRVHGVSVVMTRRLAPTVERRQRPIMAAVVWIFLMQLIQIIRMAAFLWLVCMFMVTGAVLLVPIDGWCRRRPAATVPVARLRSLSTEIVSAMRRVVGMSGADFVVGIVWLDSLVIVAVSVKRPLEVY